LQTLGGFAESSRNPLLAKHADAPVRQTGLFQDFISTESQFVVENIVTDIAEMVYFAGNHALPKGNAIVVNSQEAGAIQMLPFMI